MWVPRACECRRPGKPEALDLLKLELELAVKLPHVRAGNAARVVCRRNYHWPLSNLPRPPAAFQLTFHFLDPFHMTAVLYLLKWTENFKKHYFFIRQWFILRVMYNRSSLWERTTYSHSCFAIFFRHFVKMLYFNGTCSKALVFKCKNKVLRGHTQMTLDHSLF